MQTDLDIIRQQRERASRRAQKAQTETQVRERVQARLLEKAPAKGKAPANAPTEPDTNVSAASYGKLSSMAASAGVEEPKATGALVFAVAKKYGGPGQIPNPDLDKQNSYRWPMWAEKPPKNPTPSDSPPDEPKEGKDGGDKADWDTPGDGETKKGFGKNKSKPGDG